MKFTGFATSLALAGFAYSAALPTLGNVRGTVAGVTDTVVGGVVGPVVSTTGALAGAAKREDFTGLGSTVQAVPSVVNGGIAIAAGAVGTGESLASGITGSLEGAVKRDELAGLGSTVETVPSTANAVVDIAAGGVGTAESVTSNAVYTAEGVVGKAGAAGKRQLENLAGPIAGSTAAIAGSAVPAVVQEVGTTVGGAVKRDAQSLGGNIDNTVLNIVAAFTQNPNGFAGALAGLKNAVNLGEITQGQLSELPALNSVLALLNL